MMRSYKAILLRLSSIVICTVPVAIATLTYFPVWKNRSPAALFSGFTVLLLIICIYPIIKAIKRFLKSPSVFGIWLLLFLTFMIVKSIAYEMTVISFVGMVSNLIGAFLFKISKREVEK